MAVKTRLKILETDHDSALAQFIENEINLIMLERRAKDLKPGKEYDETQTLINQKKTNQERIETILSIVKELIEKEKKNG
jgi:gamma-glutamyl phosphate reductase